MFKIGNLTMEYFVANISEESGNKPFQVLIWCAIGAYFIWKSFLYCVKKYDLLAKKFFRANSLPPPVKAFFDELKNDENLFRWKSFRQEAVFGEKILETDNLIFIWSKPWYLKKLSLWCLGYFVEYEVNEYLICWNPERDEICLAKESFDLTAWKHTGQWEKKYVGQSLEVFVGDLDPEEDDL